MSSSFIGRTCDDGMRIRDVQIFCNFRRTGLKAIPAVSSLSSAYWRLSGWRMELTGRGGTLSK